MPAIPVYQGVVVDDPPSGPTVEQVFSDVYDGVNSRTQSAYDEYNDRRNYDNILNWAGKHDIGGSSPEETYKLAVAHLQRASDDATGDAYMYEEFSGEGRRSNKVVEEYMSIIDQFEGGGISYRAARAALGNMKFSEKWMPKDAYNRLNVLAIEKDRLTRKKTPTIVYVAGIAIILCAASGAICWFSSMTP